MAVDYTSYYQPPGFEDPEELRRRLLEEAMNPVPVPVPAGIPVPAPGAPMVGDTGEVWPEEDLNKVYLPEMEITADPSAYRPPPMPQAPRPPVEEEEDDPGIIGSILGKIVGNKSGDNELGLDADPYAAQRAAAEEEDDPRDSFAYRFKRFSDGINNMQDARNATEAWRWGRQYSRNTQDTAGQYLREQRAERREKEQREEVKRLQSRQDREEGIRDKQLAYQDALRNPNSPESLRTAKIFESMPGVPEGQFQGVLSAAEMQEYGGNFVELLQVSELKKQQLEVQRRERAGTIDYLKSAAGSTVADAAGRPQALPDALLRQIGALTPDSTDSQIEAVQKELTAWQSGGRGEQKFGRAAVAAAQPPQGPTGIPQTTQVGMADLYGMDTAQRSQYIDQLAAQRNALNPGLPGAKIIDSRVNEEIKRAIEINQQDIPGLVQTPAVDAARSKEALKAMEAKTNIDRLAREAETLIPKDTVDATGRAIVGMVPGTESAQQQKRLQQLMQEIGTQLRVLDNLGVPSGPDQLITTQTTGDPGALVSQLGLTAGPALRALRGDTTQRALTAATQRGYALPERPGGPVTPGRPPKVNQVGGAPPPRSPKPGGGGKVRVRLPDGRIGTLDEDKVEEAVRRGAVVL